MTDNDVFDRCVGARWKIASRLSFGPVFDNISFRHIIRAIEREVEHNDVPGFKEAVDIVHGVLKDAPTNDARLGALQQLDRIRCERGSANTELTVAACKHLLMSSGLSLKSSDADDLRLAIATQVVAEVSLAHLCPARLLEEVGPDCNLKDFSDRRRQISDVLSTSPFLRTFSRALLSDLSTSSIRAPRVATVRRSQQEILMTALSN
jgi:hypothetical protein